MTTNDASQLKGKRGIKRLINAARYSADGFRAAFKNEDAFRQECVLTVVLSAALPFIEADAALRLLTFLSMAGVLITELLNSGIEAAIDRIGLEIHPLSKYAKDAGSCAVMIALASSGASWATLLWSVLAA